MNIVKSVGRIVSTILVAAAVVQAVARVGVRLIGFEVYTVLSGSMEPAYQTGSVIWVQECEPEEVEVGDAITFVMNEDLVVATHRVVEIDAENQYFYTKGDANDAPDAAPVHFNNLIGTPVFTVPHLGYFVNYIQNPPGCYVALVVCAVVLILMFLPDVFAKDEEEEDRKAARKPKRPKKAGAEVESPPRPKPEATARGVSPPGALPEDSGEDSPPKTGRHARHARAEEDSKASQKTNNPRHGARAEAAKNGKYQADREA